MKIPAGIFNSASGTGRNFAAGFTHAVGKSGSRWSAIMSQQGLQNQLSMAGRQANAAVFGNISGGFRAIRSAGPVAASGNFAKANKIRAMGAGRMAGGAAMGWAAMGAVNIFRPGDNIGMF